MYEPPKQAAISAEEPIRMADWIELNLLTQEESSVSVSDVTANIAGDPPDESATSEHRDDFPEDPEDPDPSTLNTGYWQAAETAAELAFIEMGQRSSWLGTRYPLVLDGDTVTVDASFDSNGIAAFLTLLRSRHLYYRALEDDGVRAGLLFEELLPYVLRRYLGTSEAKAVRFGVAGGSRGDGLPLETDAALDALSQRMNEPRGHLTGLPNGDDLGADSVAWRPFQDPFRGKLTTVGQATISERKWTKKQPSPKWKSGRLIRLLTPPTTVVAFVESVSLTSNALLDGLGKQFSSLPLDRFRMLFFLHDHDVPCSLRNRIERWSAQMRARLPR